MPKHAPTCIGVLTQIRAHGVHVGVSLNPASPISMVQHVLHLVDLVLVMSVNPGFGGQTFIAEVLPKVEALRALQQRSAKPFRISIDGGITQDTIGQAANAGADVFVAGSAIFGAHHYGDAMNRLRKLSSGAEAHLSTAG